MHDAGAPNILRGRIGLGGPWTVGFFWIAVSMVGAVAAALAAWRVRTLIIGGPEFLGRNLGYVAKVVEAMVISGAQWLLLRRYRLPVDWWVPTTVTANLLTAVVVIPNVLGAILGKAGGPGGPNMSIAVIAGGAALASAGLLVGSAQWLVLRGLGRRAAFAWIPASVVGGGLAGSATTLISSHLVGMPAFVFLGVVAAVGALLQAAIQAPVLGRLALKT